MLSRTFLLSAFIALSACAVVHAGVDNPACQLKNMWISGNAHINFAANNYGPYTATVDKSVSSINIVAWAQDTSSSLTLRIDANGGSQYVSSASMSTPIAIQCGVTTTIAVVAGCATCTNTYLINILRSGCGGGVQGDPQFTGLRGQDYQVHGIGGEYYNLISDSSMQLNSKFVFLDHGHCPDIPGLNKTTCWTHPGTYLGELGLKTCSGDELHIVSGSAKNGFSKITLNGKPLLVGEQAPLLCDHGASGNDKAGSTNGYIFFNHSHTAVIRSSVFEIVVENSDWFVNQHIKVLDWKSLNAHGLIGQTWRKPKHPKQIKFVEGMVDDYQIASHNLFSDDFVFNQFHVDDEKVMNDVDVDDEGENHKH